MTCATRDTRFRLLDPNVGWEPSPVVAAVCHLDGLDDSLGLRLQDDHLTALSDQQLSRFLLPRWLARGCRPCEAYLVSCATSNHHPQPRLLRRDPCTGDWANMLDDLAGSGRLVCPVAVAADGPRLAVVDAGDARHPPHLFVWSIPDGRLTVLRPLEQPGAVAFAPWRELLLTSDHEPTTVQRFDWVGTPLGTVQAAVPIDRFARGNDWLAFDPESLELRDAIDRSPAEPDFPWNQPGQHCALWAATKPGTAPFQLVRFTPQGYVETPAAVATSTTAAPPTQCRLLAKPLAPCPLPVIRRFLESTFRPTGVVRVSPHGFCLEQPAPDGATLTHCFRPDGSPAAQSDVAPPTPPPAPRFGQLLTAPIDSYLPRCRWHRIRVEAEIPPGTSLSVAVATNDERLLEQPAACPETPQTWDDFPPGAPHPDDWHEPGENATDFLIDQPPGRYLYLRIRLSATTHATPRIHRIRLDFPRATSLDQLPPVFRDNPETEDFAERFLALFDASIDDLDRAIERFPAILDAAAVPGEVLPWLGRFLGIAFDPAWDDTRRRALLRAVPSLYAQRGTLEGLLHAVEVLFGVRPAIDERMHRRLWAVLRRDARLREARLFGKSAARLRVARSALGHTPLRSFGDPDLDPFRVHAHRFEVFMPPAHQARTLDAEALDRLIALQKPAHTAHRLHLGGSGLIVGARSVVGVDTKLVATPPPVLGSGHPTAARAGTARLDHRTILRPGPHSRGPGLQIGITSAVGIHTLVLE